MTLFSHSACEHGEMKSHQTYIKDRRGNITAEGPVCPGGTITPIPTIPAWLCVQYPHMTFTRAHTAGDVGRYADGTCAICNQSDSDCRWVAIIDAALPTSDYQGDTCTPTPRAP